MNYPKKELAQLLISYCEAYHVEDVVISPGSRNAPLTIGFTNHKNFKTYSIVDERCAAFFALGIAQQKRKPVVLVCTSGSALLNYYPAVAEAFYSDIPLIVISADRPRHLIDIGDGQTIRQENVFQNHSLFNANLVENNSYTSANSSLIEDAILTSINQNGPVHINAPFDEPLYEVVEELSVSKVEPKILSNKDVISENELKEFAELWNASTKKMILIGSNFPDTALQKHIHSFADDKSVLVLTETTSNLDNENVINGIDKLIIPLKENEFQQLQPDVLLTLGGLVVSKKIKQFLRKYQPKHHWHIDKKKGLDTFNCLSKHFRVDATVFFKEFNKIVKVVDSTYQSAWMSLKLKRADKHKAYLEKSKFSDLNVFDKVLKSIPNNSMLQLGNSSVIRYTQLFDVNPTLKIFCNRGTSGIDGSTSTAIGAALVRNEETTFITGDISFFYDSNALWNKHIKSDFRIILINNGGGGIFRFILGPTSTNAIDYFETGHGLNAFHLCTMFGFDYECAVNEADLNQKLKDFYKVADQPKLLEIITPKEENDAVLKEYFKYLK